MSDRNIELEVLYAERNNEMLRACVLEIEFIESFGVPEELLERYEASIIRATELAAAIAVEILKPHKPTLRERLFPKK